MTVPKRYFHDRLILLLLTTNSFITILITVLLLLRLETGRGGGYIVQYRANLGLGAYKAGSAFEILSFIALAMIVFVLHLMLSMRVYHPRRHLALAVLGLGLLLLIMALVVTNALLVLR